MRKLALGLSTLLTLFACASLKVADDAPPDDEGGTDGGPEANATDGNLDPVDAGPPPPDFVCTKEDAWVKTPKATKECEARSVTTVDTDLALDGTGISIARTKAGRIGIVYYVGAFADSGEMRLATIIPKTRPFVFTPFKRSLGDFAKAGLTARIAASGNDTFEIIAHDVYDTTGDVNLVRLVDGVGPLTTALPVFLGLASPTQLTIAADRNTGTLYATALKTTQLDGGTVKGDVLASRKVAGTDWASLPPVVQGLTVDQAPGVGSGALTVDANGTVHFAYHWCDGFNSSVPRYHTFDGNVWSDRKTIDNNIIDGLSGFSVDLALFGNTKYAAYYFKKAGQIGNPPSADLRVASWQAVLDTPAVEIIEQTIPAPNFDPPSVPPTYRVAMDVDKYGLVHLAIIGPDSDDGTRGVLEYRRQTRDPSGALKWISDIVDDDVLADGSNGKAFVDLVVDDNARPHIAYRSGKSFQIKYATRTDR